jgi:hypothetical protein
MNRLIADVQFRWSPQDSFHPLPRFLPSWNYFPLQDAVDFAVFAVRTTIDTMRFLPRLRTVGGPIYVHNQAGRCTLAKPEAIADFLINKPAPP